MNYHLIRTDDMLNGSGLRVVLFVSGCNHKCDGCHNPETWNADSGKRFTDVEKNIIFNELDKEYINGITFSGGDPLHTHNVADVCHLILEIKNKYNKNIWVYTGYRIEYLLESEDTYITQILKNIDVLVDGKFDCSLKNENYPWAGSTNQRVIDVKRTIKTGEITLWNS